MDKPTLKQSIDNCKLKPVNKLKFRFMVGVANTLFRKKLGVSFTYVHDIKPYRGKP